MLNASCCRQPPGNLDSWKKCPKDRRGPYARKGRAYPCALQGANLKQLLAVVAEVHLGDNRCNEALSEKKSHQKITYQEDSERMARPRPAEGGNH